MSDGTPEPDSLASRLAQLSPAKRALFEMRLREAGAAPTISSGIPRAERTGPLPLSFAQHRLWFINQLEPGPQYNMSSRTWLDGPLDVPALQRALNDLQARHESLRTTFPAEQGVPRQVIGAPTGIPLATTDLREVPAAERDSELRRLLRQEMRRHFDLARGPLIRACLMRTAEEQHALLLAMHHIVSDGWSQGVLFRELAALYEAHAAGRPATLPPLPIQYADFAVWQRERMQGERFLRELDYWRSRFPSAPAPLELPSDRPRPRVQSHRGARVKFTVPAELAQALRALGQQQGATLFMTVLAAFVVLLARYSGRRTIVVGSPSAGRNRPETDGLIGLFVNTLALRTDLTGDPSFRELLRRVREVALGAYEHQDFPFEKLVEEVQPERDLARQPLFQVMFALQNTPKSERRLAGLTMRTLERAGSTAKFDLSLTLREREGGLDGTLSYSTDLFDAPRMERMAGHLGVLLDAVVAQPSTRVSMLPLLTPEERRDLLAWGAGRPLNAPDGRNATVVEALISGVERTPDAPAVVGADGIALTWAQLHERARQLAGHLRRQGVGPEARVALYLEPSPERLVAMLAVLLAGGAYLPLEPGHPPERLAWILKDAAVRLVVTHEPTRATVEKLPSDITVICLDGDRRTIAQAEPLASFAAPAPEQIAYVMYTSGSTGTPKGVAVSHGALTAFARAAADAYQLGPTDRVLQFSGFSSDLSIDEIFPAWLSGAAVVTRSPGPAPLGAELMRMVRARGISVLSLPTAVWHAWARELAEAPGVDWPASLRLVIVGGEAAQPAMLAAWRRLGPAAPRWINTYGPTEATVEATLYEPPPETDGSGTVPIGRPIAGRRVYVLDQHLDLVPIGVPGELCLGGEGVARGYLHRPGATAERFAPDPFSPAPGARLYRTGDRARWLPDGNLEFLGRSDDQVKIRGHRVEPREVEAMLRTHAAVREAAVIARERVPGEWRLIAYAVAASDRKAELEPEHLRDFLQLRLPEHMVPPDIVLLEALPVTASGKVDRGALPDPADVIAAEPDTAMSPLEEIVAGIFAQVLRRPRVGPHESFFALGGHSLLATQAIARIRAACGVELPLRTLFEAPTAAGIALAVVTLQAQGADVDLEQLLAEAERHSQESEPGAAG